jgi:hypothetical protein
LRTLACQHIVAAMTGRMTRTPLFGLLAMMCASGCQSAPPMSHATFTDAAKRCELLATTYTYRDGIFLDEPLVDFTKEPASAKALTCFNLALEKIDREATERGATYIRRIWEFRS